MCVQYIGGCSVHRRIFSTLENVQYIGGCSVHQGDTMRTLGDIISGCVQYIGGIPWVHRGDTMSASGRYHEYIEGCSVHRDTMSTLGRYHEYIEGISLVHRGMFSTSRDVQYIRDFNRNWKVFTNLLPHMHHYIPRCTHDIPRCTHDIPEVLMISPWCTHGIPPMYWTSPDVLMISPACIMVSPTCIMVSPRCTEHPSSACSKFWGCQGRRTGVTTVSNSLILGGRVTKVLKNGDEK